MSDSPVHGPTARRSRLLGALLATALIFLIVGTALGAFVSRGTDAPVAVPPAASNTATGGTATPKTLSFVSSGGINDLSALVQRVNPSVVQIEVASGQGLQQSQGLGTGIVIDQQGHILTNDHVTAGAQQMTVTFTDGTKADAKLVGDDPGDDLAVIQVSAPAGELSPATFADSDQVKPGDAVFAIGNPFGLQFSVSAGIVSGVDRQSPGGAPNGEPLPHMIQTDAALNPGNSGGPLFNANGEVIGINESIENPSGQRVFAGVGFAVASNTATRVLSDLIAGKTVSHAQLGVTAATLDATTAQLAHVTVQSGVYVMSVLPGSAADHAGLRGAITAGGSVLGSTVQPGGDVITAVDGQSVTTIAQLSSIVSSHHVGDTLRLTIVRNGSTMDVMATLQEWVSAG